MLGFSKLPRKTVVIKAHSFYSALYNDSKYEFVVDSKNFKTMTHYYYYCVSGDNKELQNNIIKFYSINNIRLLVGRLVCNRLSNPNSIISYYNTNKIHLSLINGIIEKCQQNMNVKMLLLATGDSHINYYCDGDSYLGVGDDGNGLNVMGVMFMIVRAKFKGKNTVAYAEDKLYELNRRIRIIEMSKPFISLSTIPEETDED